MKCSPLLIPVPVTAPSVPVTPADTRWAQVLVIVLVGALAACQIGKVAPSLPVLRADLDISMFGAGWIASVYPGTAVVLGLIGGALADRFGHRNAMAVGLLLIALGSAAGSMVGSLGPMIVTRIVEGAGFVLIAVAAPALVIAAATARDRGLAMGIWGLFMPIGVTTMLLLSPVVLAIWGWRALWLVNAGLGVAAVALLLASGTGRRRIPINSSQLWRDLAVTVRSPAPWVLAAASVMFGLKYSAFNAWLPTYLMEVQGHSAAQAGAMAAIVAVSHAPGVLLGGWLVGRGLPRWVAIGGASLGMGLAAWATFSLGLPPLVAFAAAVLFGFVSGFVPSAMLTAAPHFATSMGQIGAFNGIIIHGANVGVLAAAPAFAAVASNLGGWPAAGFYLALVGVVGMAGSLAIRVLERRRAAGSR